MGLFTKAVLTLARGLTPRDPALVAYLGGEPSDAGESVSVDASLRIDAVWACVRLISQTVATLPLQIYRYKGKDVAEVDYDHYLYEVLHDRPNYDMTAVNYWEAKVASLLLWGNAYSAIARGAGGRVVGLFPMRPDCMGVRREKDGSLVYSYDNRNGVRQEFQEDDVFHIKGFSLDGLLGLSPIAQARNTLGIVRAAQKSSGAIFRNGMRIPGFLKAPDYLSDDQRTQAKVILERFRGAENAGKVPLIEGGWDFKELGIPPADAQLLQTQAFHVEQICRWFDVPPPMIGHMEKATAWGTGLEQMNLWFLTYCLRSHMKRIEQQIVKSLMTPADRKQIYPEYNIEGLLRADSSARANLYSSFAQNGIMTRNEIRSKENMPPMEGADDLTVQSNLVPLERLGEKQASLEAPPADPAIPIPEIRQ